VLCRLAFSVSPLEDEVLSLADNEAADRRRLTWSDSEIFLFDRVAMFILFSRQQPMRAARVGDDYAPPHARALVNDPNDPLALSLCFDSILANLSHSFYEIAGSTRLNILTALREALGDRLIPRDPTASPLSKLLVFTGD